MPKPLALIVDDEADVRSFVASILQRDGFSTLEAEDGEEALDLVRAAPAAFTVIVSDLIMPRMGGAALADRLKREFPAIRILIMSAYFERVPAGIPVLPKPFTAEELSDAIRRLVRNSRSGGSCC